MTTDPVVIGKLVNATNGSQRMVLVVDKLAGRGLDIVDSDGVNSRKYFGRGHPTAVREELSADVLGDIGVAIEAHEHGGLEVDLGPFDLFLGGVVDKTYEVGHDVPHEIIKLIVGGDGIEAE